MVEQNYGVAVAVAVAVDVAVDVGVAVAGAVVFVGVALAAGGVSVTVGVALGTTTEDALKICGATQIARSPAGEPVESRVRMNFTSCPTNALRSISAE